MTNRALIRLGAIEKKDLAFDYTDTDSFVLSSSVIPYAIEHNMIGKNLGDLDDELNGGKIIRAIYLAPKTYILEFVTPENKKMWKVRCKGIPHENGFIDANKDHHLTEEQAIEKIKGGELRKGVYELYDVETEQTIAFSKVITMFFFEQMRLERANVRAFYGTLKRDIMTKSRETKGEYTSTIVKSDCERVINNSAWWRSNEFRVLKEESHYNENELSIPIKD